MSLYVYTTFEFECNYCGKYHDKRENIVPTGWLVDVGIEDGDPVLHHFCSPQCVDGYKGYRERV